MRHFSNRLQSVFLSLSALLLVAAVPMTAAAEQAPGTSAQPNALPQPSSPSTITPVSPVVTPVQPATPATPPAIQPTYTYNHDTAHWDTSKWYYDPVTKSYQPIAQPKAPVQSAPVAPVTVIDPSAPSQNSSPQPNMTAPTNSLVVPGATSTTTAVTNGLNSTALTGNANVSRNSLGGNATSGTANAAATILNNVNSSVSNTSNQKAASFVSNVMGDVNGDIILQPLLLKAMLEAGSKNSGASTIVTTNQLTNNVNLNAASGNAAVSSNTKAGNATTGSANTVANVLNIVNSMVSANQSFIGTVNIYGNLNGDILIAPDFIPQLLASNAASPTIQVPTSALPTTSINNTESIVNNVALAATSGKAAVTGNTSAGSATSGSGMTNVVLFNLSGHQVVAKNSLLVFVNVLGKWVGVIVDAPAGATAAAIGNGVSSNTTVAPDLILNATNSTQITNNLTLNSHTGDALVGHNTAAGNAVSGNATASANIGNIVSSQLGLSDWFGVLFINVFGSWYGSFGIDTAAGNSTASLSTTTASGASGPLRVFDFIPRTFSTGRTHAPAGVTVIDVNSATPSSGAVYAPAGDGQGPILASTQAPITSHQTNSPTALTQLTDGSQQLMARLPMLAGASFLTIMSLLGLRRTLFGKADPSGVA
jgi:hypothetical protein